MRCYPKWQESDLFQKASKKKKEENNNNNTGLYISSFLFDVKAAINSLIITLKLKEDIKGSDKISQTAIVFSVFTDSMYYVQPRRCSFLSSNWVPSTFLIIVCSF